MNAVLAPLPHASFDAELARHQLAPLSRENPVTLQVNVGKLCNQACHHCHVDAGPKRTEVMSRRTAERVIELLANSRGIGALDLTGGAPELNPNFRMLVEAARGLARRVMVRCNLTVLGVDGMDWLPKFYRANAVELFCSLPCYSQENVDRQRGRGVFDRSIIALRELNALGYGRDGSGLVLDLVYNPVGASLPPAQGELEARYRAELGHNWGIVFNRLLTITNMPIKRFADQLRQWGSHDEYLGLLVNHFNPTTVPGLMCRHLVSVGFDGILYDCDFNQMLEMPIVGGGGPLTIDAIDDLGALSGRRIATGGHCFGCTAGAGSSCGGAIA